MVNEAVILDLKILEELDITLEQFMIIYSIYLKRDLTNLGYVMEPDSLLKLEQKRFIKLIDNDILLREKSLELIKFLSIQSESSFKEQKKEIKKSRRKVSEEVEDRVEEFRNLWKGLKPGSMGSLKSCKEKLTRWMKENPNYSFDEILNAAKIYLNTEGANLRFLQRADYFIFKKDGPEESSRLSAFIDEIDQEEVDWTSKLN